VKPSADSLCRQTSPADDNAWLLPGVVVSGVGSGTGSYIGSGATAG